MNAHLFVIAKITPKPAFFESAKKAIENIVPSTLKEQGCVSFNLHENQEGELFLYEQWVDEAALAAHYEQDYTKAVFSAYEDWLSLPPEIYKMHKVA